MYVNSKIFVIACYDREWAIVKQLQHPLWSIMMKEYMVRTFFKSLKMNECRSPWRVPSIRHSSSKWQRNFFTEFAPSSEFSVDCWTKNCPERRNVSPWTNSAAVACKSSLQAARMPSRIDSTFVHLLFAWHFTSAFSWRWSRSTIASNCRSPMDGMLPFSNVLFPSVRSVDERDVIRTNVSDRWWLWEVFQIGKFILYRMLWPQSPLLDLLMEMPLPSSETIDASKAVSFSFLHRHYDVIYVNVIKLSL